MSVYGAFVERCWEGDSKVLGENHVPGPNHQPQIPYKFVCDRKTRWQAMI
jgi:hypothetical protein